MSSVRRLVIVTTLAFVPGILTAFLLGIALVFANKPLFLPSVLTNVASVATTLHALGFSKLLIRCSVLLPILILNLFGITRARRNADRGGDPDCAQIVDGNGKTPCNASMELFQLQPIVKWWRRVLWAADLESGRLNIWHGQELACYHFASGFVRR